jgi:formate transporter
MAITKNSGTAVPVAQYIGADRVMRTIAQHGAQKILGMNPLRIFALAVLAGGFLTIGALLSVQFAVGTDNAGLIRILGGMGFSTGFLFVILTGSLLFTEVNVMIPGSVIHHRYQVGRIVRFWGLVWLGNLVGALLVGFLLGYALVYPPESRELLQHIVDVKMSYQQIGGVNGWTEVVVSGAFANWMVGFAAFFSVMGRTIVDKAIPVFLAVTAFVACGFQHSPANMSYFSLATGEGFGPDWVAAMVWNIIPAGIGNILGGALMVAAIMSYAHGSGFRDRRSARHGNESAAADPHGEA